MARLPQPGGDAGNWGQILNDYLLETHAADGSLKPAVVKASALAPDAVTATALSSNSVTTNSLSATGGADGQVLVKDSAITGGMKWANAPTAPSASAATVASLGTVQLAGDLAGTATAPTVPALADKLATDTLDTDGALAANSDVKIATQKAVKTYVDKKVATLSPVLLIDTVNDLPAGTAAGTVVVVKS